MTLPNSQLRRGLGPTEITEAGSPPAVPTLAVEVADGVLIATVGGDAGVQHTLYGTTGSAWATLGSRFGNGQITVSDLSPGLYRLMAIDTDSGLPSLPSPLAAATVEEYNVTPTPFSGVAKAPGRSFQKRLRAKGVFAAIRIGNSEAGQTWGIERVTGQVIKGGQVR